MTIEQWKWFCKQAVENGNRPFTREQKEILKLAIDKANNLEELLLIAMESLNY